MASPASNIGGSLCADIECLINDDIMLSNYALTFEGHPWFLDSEGKHGIVPRLHILAIQPWSASISGTSHSYRASRDSRSKLGAFPGQSDARKPGGSCRGVSPHNHRERMTPSHWTT